MADDLVERLRIKADMIHLGETIAWGSDVALMHEAAARITDLEARLAAAEAGEDALAEALRKIANCGQSAEPDHWKFRCMVRETARAALQGETK